MQYKKDGMRGKVEGVGFRMGVGVFEFNNDNLNALHLTPYTLFLKPKTKSFFNTALFFII